jgi:hypothetical protein
VLGVREVVGDDGAAIDIAGPKQRALRSMLAVDGGQVVSTDRLVDALFDSAATGDAANARQHHVSRLRKAIGRDRVTSHESAYELGVAPDSPPSPATTPGSSPADRRTHRRSSAVRAHIWAGSVTTVVTEPTQMPEWHAARPDRRVGHPGTGATAQLTDTLTRGEG